MHIAEETQTEKEKRITGQNIETRRLGEKKNILKYFFKTLIQLPTSSVTK